MRQNSVQEALPPVVDQMSVSELLTWGRTPRKGISQIFVETPSGLANDAGDAIVQSTSDYAFKPFSFQAASPLTPVEIQPIFSMPAEQAKALWTQPTESMMTKRTDLSYDRAEVLHHSRGPMVDLSSYKDLTIPPVFEESELIAPPTTVLPERERPPMSSPTSMYAAVATAGHPEIQEGNYEIYAEYSENVKKLVQLVTNLPEGITKQTGAQVIRLTMESMGISMENVLSDAQNVQSELLDAVRSNIKKIEEYKTIIRKLESEIRYHQGKANELSEIIDLFILSNTSPNMPRMDHAESGGY